MSTLEECTTSKESPTPTPTPTPTPPSSLSLRSSRKSLQQQQQQQEGPRPTPRPAILSQRNARNLIPTSKDEHEHVKRWHGLESWQLKVISLINSSPVQHFFMALLVLDVLVLFIELYLDAAYPHCFYVERDAVSCCPAHDAGGGTDAAADDEGQSHRRRHLWSERELAEDSDHHTVCDYPLEEYGGTAACDDHKYPAVHRAHTALFAITISILSVFMIELAVLILTMGARKFFGHCLYILDLIVVVASLALELTFHFLHEELLAAATGIIVFGRVWRFIRIGHGLVVSTYEIEAEKVHELRHQNRELVKQLELRGWDVPEELKATKHYGSMDNHSSSHSENEEEEDEA